MRASPRRTDILSERELLEWLRVKPRTLEWDALLVYDRTRANHLLMQEYIRRLHVGSFLPPISQLITHVQDAHWEYIADYRLAAPLLSFEDSSIANSKANLTMHIVDGTQWSIEKEKTGTRHIVRIEEDDPLQGPKLTGKVYLNDVEGHVSTDGKVKINLHEAMDLRLTYAGTRIMRERAGEYFQQMFEALSPDKQVFVISELGPVDGNDFLDPKTFMFRIFRAKDAQYRNSPTWGEGAILAFINGEGNQSNQGPISEDGWVYPIPEGQSLTLLISNHFFIRRLLENGIRQMADANVAIEFDNANNPSAPVGEMRVSGYKKPVVAEGSNAEGSEYFDKIRFTVTFRLDSEGPKDAPFAVRHEQERVILEWKGSTVGLGTDRIPKLHVEWQGRTADVEFEAAWHIRRVYVFEADRWGARLSPVREEYHDELSFAPTKVMPESANDIRERWHNLAQFILVSYLGYTFDTIIAPTREIDLFRLHSLLFRDAYSMKLSSGHYPTDLAMFGQLGPHDAYFVVEPQEVRLLAGGEQQMTSLEGVTWSVEGVPGFEGAVGTISADGRYTAPDGSAFEGGYTLVLVTATLARHTSSSLVQVVRRSVVCNPRVVVVGMNAQVAKFSAGSLGGGALDWKLASRSGARLTDEPPKDPDLYDAGDHFYLSGPSPSLPDKPGVDDFFGIDEVTVTNEATGDVATSYVVTLLADGLVTPRPVPGSLTASTVKLQLWANSPDPMPEPEWRVLLGDGTIDAEGVYTADLKSPLKFVVITGYKDYGIPGVSPFCGYILLPVPLVDIETLKDDLDPGRS